MGLQQLRFSSSPNPLDTPFSLKTQTDPCELDESNKLYCFDIASI